MPNWCSNDIKIKFNKKLSNKEKEAVEALMREGDVEFTFNKIIQQPELLINCPIGAKTKENKSKWFKKYRDIAPRQVVYACLDNEQYYYNIHNEWKAVDYYKEENVILENNEEWIPTWYDWNLENWGTKWDADFHGKCWEEDESNGSILAIGFSTAWGFGAESITTELLKIIHKENLDVAYIEGNSEEPGNDIAFEFDAYLEDGEVFYSESEKEMVEYICNNCGDVHETRQNYDDVECEVCEKGLYKK